MKGNSSPPAADQTLTHRHISTTNHAQPPPSTKDLIHHHHQEEDHIMTKSTSKKQTPAKSCCGGGGGGGSGYNYCCYYYLNMVVGDASFMKWTSGHIMGVVKYHPIPCVFAASLLFFMAVEYTLSMIPSSSPPFDIGFVATAHLHRFLQSRPNFNTLFAGLNTVFVGMQTGYILWTWLVEGRPRATIAALFMFTFRGILGYSTQLPLPEGFLGSGVDFPVGNVSFFLFYSGHVAASIIASLDMKRMQRWELACIFDVLNILQVVRLLSTRGHYTIDLAVGVGAGILFDSLAGKYEFGKRIAAADEMGSSITYGAFLTPSKHENGNGVHY